MRRYIRHPSDIPISYSLGCDSEHSEQLQDVGKGGLCFHSHTPVESGVKIIIEIDLEVLPFQAEGIVAWCKKENQHYAVGVAFNDDSTEYGVRMAEQICHIEHYRSHILKTEGRALDSEEAAKEWIDRYAADFPPQ